MRASDTLADSRVQKPKNFLAFFSRLLPPPLHREAEKEMERKFLVLLRRFSLRKEQSYFNIFVCSFLHPHGDRGASSPRSVVTLNSVTSTTGRGNSKIMCLPHPPCARTTTPAVFRRNYKTAWIAPLILRVYIVSVSTSTAIATFIFMFSQTTIVFALCKFSSAIATLINIFWSKRRTPRRS